PAHVRVELHQVRGLVELPAHVVVDGAPARVLRAVGDHGAHRRVSLSSALHARPGAPRPQDGGRGVREGPHPLPTQRAPAARFPTSGASPLAAGEASAGRRGSRATRRASSVPDGSPPPTSPGTPPPATRTPRRTSYPPRGRRRRARSRRR